MHASILSLHVGLIIKAAVRQSIVMSVHKLHKFRISVQDVTPALDVLAGRREGYGLQRVYNNAKTPYKSVTAATHGYHTDQARKRASRTSNKNTYEPRTLIPNTLVAQYGTLLKDIEKAGWFQDLGTFDRHYEKVNVGKSSVVAKHSKCMQDSVLKKACCPIMSCVLLSRNVL